MIMLAYFHKYKNTATQKFQYAKMLVRNELYALSQATI